MQSTTAPRRRSTVGRRLALVVAAAAVVATSVAGTSAPATAQATRNPILFVHGYGGSAGNWNTMISRFRSAGYTSNELMAITYNSALSNTTIAGQVRTAADNLRSRTGAAKIDIVAHSMGSLSTRYYLKNLGGSSVVDDWVSLGGPNHGTTSALACTLISLGCVDMVAGSLFLLGLNAGDESPGSTSYSTVWSSCDGVIIPATSTIVSGANNNQLGCVTHLALLTDQTAFNRTRSLVA
ncbi:MAG TPA: triacylglycerol lipase [Acidimicrobiales bacterium]|nr:triacylglycerol lipase [Acidimicrobiales bacterium]